VVSRNHTFLFGRGVSIPNKIMIKNLGFRFTKTVGHCQTSTIKPVGFVCFLEKITNSDLLSKIESPMLEMKRKLLDGFLHAHLSCTPLNRQDIELTRNMLRGSVLTSILPKYM
jgi:hypothetical protein